MDVNKKRVAVILDTDIGGDIDDTWALALMLKSPEFDVKLIVSDTGDTTYRTKLIARLLEVAGRTDIPIGVGKPLKMSHEYDQGVWVEGYSLAAYPGRVYEDGVGAIIETIMKSPVPVTLICIGPMPNIAEALQREPRIVNNARLVGMFGSVRTGKFRVPGAVREYNVASDPVACQRAFAAAWDVTITPLDTCGGVVLAGKKYRAVRHCRDPLIQALMDNYRVWLNTGRGPLEDLERKSSVLFDTVAIYLAFSNDLCVMEDLGIRVTDDGYTRMDDTARRVRVAAAWKDLGAFEDLLVHRLAGGSLGGG